MLNRRALLKVGAAACLLPAASLQASLQASNKIITGLPAIDAALPDGIGKGTIISVLGPTASGKTSLLHHIVKSNPGHNFVCQDDLDIRLYMLYPERALDYFEMAKLRSSYLFSLERGLHERNDNAIVTLRTMRSTITEGTGTKVSGPASMKYLSSVILSLEKGPGDTGFVRLTKNRYQREFPSCRVRFTKFGIIPS